MLEKQATDGIVRSHSRRTSVKTGVFQQESTFAPEAVNHRLGTRTVKIIELCSRTFQVTVVIEEAQAPEKLLMTAGEKGTDVRGMKEPVTADVAKNLKVALCEPN